MAEALTFETQFDPAHGRAVEVSENVLRVTAGNASPFTFHGTNSYVVGRDTVVVIDPGPENDAHYAVLLKAIANRPVSHILVSHTHMDHSPLARRLKAATGAPILAEGPHRPARPLRLGEVNPLDASADYDLPIDRTLADGDIIESDGFALEAVFTPGHAANHMSFSLVGTGVLFSADHVMGWSTSIVAPPDGAMSDYMASLDKLLQRDDRLYLPGHGGAITDPLPFVRGLKTHRRMREKAILERLAASDRTIPEIVAAIYRNVDPRLHGAAGLSVLAHLEDLVARGRAKVDGEPAIDARFTAA